MARTKNVARGKDTAVRYQLATAADERPTRNPPARYTLPTLPGGASSVRELMTQETPAVKKTKSKRLRDLLLGMTMPKKRRYAYGKTKKKCNKGKYRFCAKKMKTKYKYNEKNRRMGRAGKYMIRKVLTKIN